MQRLGCQKVAIADSASSKISEEYVADKQGWVIVAFATITNIMLIVACPDFY